METAKRVGMKTFAIGKDYGEDGGSYFKIGLENDYASN